MDHFVEWLSALMEVEAYGHMSFSAVQLSTWYKLLVRRVKEVVKHEILESEDPATQTKTVFNSEVEGLHYMLAPIIYRSHPLVKRL